MLTCFCCRYVGRFVPCLNKTTRRRLQTRENTGSRVQAQKSKTFSKTSKQQANGKVPGCQTVWLQHKREALRSSDLSLHPRHLFEVNLRATGSHPAHKQHMSSRFPVCTGAAVWVSLIILPCPIIDAQGLDRSGRWRRGPIEGEIRGAGGRLFGGQSGDAPSEILSLLQGQPEGNQRRF